MRPVIEFSECLFDSPKFRSQLTKNEANLDEFEGKMEKLLKLSNTMYDSGRQFIAIQSQFAAGLWELGSYFAAENPSDSSQVRFFLFRSGLMCATSSFIQCRSKEVTQLST